MGPNLTIIPFYQVQITPGMVTMLMSVNNYLEFFIPQKGNNLLRIIWVNAINIFLSLYDVGEVS
jgi:hypothetical protein